MVALVLALRVGERFEFNFRECQREFGLGDFAQRFVLRQRHFAPARVHFTLGGLPFDLLFVDQFHERVGVELGDFVPFFHARPFGEDRHELPAPFQFAGHLQRIDALEFAAVRHGDFHLPGVDVGRQRRFAAGFETEPAGAELPSGEGRGAQRDEGDGPNGDPEPRAARAFADAGGAGRRGDQRDRHFRDGFNLRRGVREAAGRREESRG